MTAPRIRVNAPGRVRPIVFDSAAEAEAFGRACLAAARRAAGPGWPLKFERKG